MNYIHSMKIGYARVSTSGQNLDVQLDALTAFGCQQIFQEKLSGKNKNRPQLLKLLEQLRPGDTVVIYKLDRLARSFRDLVDIVQQIENRGANITSLNDAMIDTTTPQGKLVFNIFASLAEFERSLIVERTNAGLASARARGRIGGRPKGLAPKALQNAKYAKILYEQEELSIAEICEQVDISRASLYKYLRHLGVKIGK